MTTLLAPLKSYSVHEKERVRSVPLRFKRINGADIYYASSEAIGTKLPSIGAPGYPFPQDRRFVATGKGDYVVNGQGVGVNLAVVAMPQLNDFVMCAMTLGGNRQMCVLGYVTQLTSATSFLVNIGLPGTLGSPTGCAVGDEIYYASPTSAAYPCWNVSIGFPAWVVGEHASEEGSTAYPYTKSPIKAYHRNSLWFAAPGFAGGQNYAFLAQAGITLPARLDPGIYSFASQNMEFHEEPANTFTNPDSMPFSVGFERPRYYCDMGRGARQKDMPPPPSDAPQLWGDPQGAPRSVVELAGGNLIDVQGPAAGDQAGNMIITKFKESWDGLPTLAQTWEVLNGAGTLRHAAAGDALHFPADLDGAIGMAIIFHGGKWHVSEITIKRRWLNTGHGPDSTGSNHVVDAGNRGQDYRWGVADDWYYRGHGGVQAGDLIQWRDPGILGNNIVQMVDNVEPDTFKDPWGGPNPHFYELINGYPFLSVGGLAGQLIANQVPVWRSPVGAVDYKGRWIVYNSDWSNPQVVLDCAKVDGEIDEGRDIELRTSQNPPGKSYKIEPYEQGSDIQIVKLPSGTISGTLYVRDSGGASFKVRTTDGINAPDREIEVNLLTATGEQANDNFLIFHPAKAGQEVFIQVGYASEQCYIERFVSFQGELYAVEAGTGKWWHWNATSGQPELSDMAKHMRLGETGMTCSPVEVEVEGRNELFAILKTTGTLGKLSTKHSGHIEQFDGSQHTITSALSQICLAFDMLAILSPDMILTVKPIYRNLAASVPIVSLLPKPRLQSGADQLPPAIRINYSGGAAQAGKSRHPKEYSCDLVKSFPQAQIIAFRRQKRSQLRKVFGEVELDYDLKLLDTVSIDVDETHSANGFITELKHNQPGKTSEITAEVPYAG